MTNFRLYARPLRSRDYQSRYGVLRGVIPEVVDKFIGCAWGNAPRHDIPQSTCPLNLINP
jgi:hypothetical protein